MNELRRLAPFVTRNGDASLAVIPSLTPVDFFECHIVLSWHKERGTVGGARVVCNGEEDAQLTLALAEYAFAQMVKRAKAVAR